jgi:hypothetical protein
MKTPKTRRRPFTLFLTDDQLVILGVMASQNGQTPAGILIDEIEEHRGYLKSFHTSHQVRKLDQLVRNGPKLSMDPRYKNVFRCPECGSGYWGTVGANDMDTAIGYCHGQDCTFKWSRRDDYLYFDVVSRSRLRS